MLKRLRPFCLTLRGNRVSFSFAVSVDQHPQLIFNLYKSTKARLNSKCYSLEYYDELPNLHFNWNIYLKSKRHSITLYNACSVHRRDVQYIGGREGVQDIGGYHEYIGGISWVHRGNIMIHVGEQVEDIGGYHEYIGGISWVHRGNIMIHVGEQVDKSLWFILKTLMYWTSPDVLMISPDVLMTSPMYWTHII